MIVIKDASYGSHERQKLDVFIPENPKSYCGVIVFIHGGGWQSGDKSGHHPDCEYFSSLGYISATLNYRFVAEDLSILGELDDITAAMKTLRNICAEYGYDLSKALLSGGSAGAHLALMYAYARFSEAPITPVAVCAYCPPVDCSKPDFLLGISGEFESWKYEIMSKCAGCKITKDTFLKAEEQKALKKMSPLYFISHSSVPTAVFHGRNDELIPLEHIKQFLEKLDRAGVKNDFLLFENSGHALDNDSEAHNAAKKIIENYAREYLNDC